jgi:hypothetical protein
MTTPRRRQVFAQRRRAALDPSGAAGSGPAPTTPPAPVSREEEERAGLIWKPISSHVIELADDGPSYTRVESEPMEATDDLDIEIVLTPSTDPTARTLVKKRKTLRLKRGRHAD